MFVFGASRRQCESELAWDFRARGPTHWVDWIAAGDHCSYASADSESAPTHAGIFQGSLRSVRT